MGWMRVCTLDPAASEPVQRAGLVGPQGQRAPCARPQGRRHYALAPFWGFCCRWRAGWIQCCEHCLQSRGPTWGLQWLWSSQDWAPGYPYAPEPVHTRAWPAKCHKRDPVLHTLVTEQGSVWGMSYTLYLTDTPVSWLWYSQTQTSPRASARCWLGVGTACISYPRLIPCCKTSSACGVGPRPMDWIMQLHGTDVARRPYVWHPWPRGSRKKVCSTNWCTPVQYCSFD